MFENQKGFILVVFFILMTTSCATLPPDYVPVLPAPARTFAPTHPALMRLPVEIIFPSGSEVARHFGNFFEAVLRPKRDKEEVIPKGGFQFHLLDIWAQLQLPIYLDKGIWLLLRPQSISLGSMRRDPKSFWTAHTMLETTSNPELIFGPKPKVTPVPMPALTTYIAGSPTFQAISNTHIKYKEVNERLRDPRMKLIGMVVPGTGGQKLTLMGMRVYGSGGKVVVEVKLHYNPLVINLESKPAKLTIYLKGTPHYLSRAQAFDLPDLDYDIKSGDMMLQVADFLFKSDFRDQLRHITRLPIGPKLEELKGKIDKALNRPLGRFAHLSANVSSLRVLGGYADNEGIMVRVSIQGTAGLQMVWN